MSLCITLPRKNYKITASLKLQFSFFKILLMDWTADLGITQNNKIGREYSS
ncbi:hypothetical protein T07_62 [Trichinella nelsoni]|uniref:Uncharacterized protein n=1 Tax=Trichinella nelsoni TaxID=6336 RepID=A0A0V0RCI8_9BILA|nr:hypothetical protein T07_62 [Trichinella nelsoni]